MLNYRENTLLIADPLDSADADLAGSYDVTVYPVGARVASVSGATITVDAGHGFRAGDKYLLNPGTDDTFSAAASSVTATTIVMPSDQSAIVSAGDILVNLGADTGTSSPNYDASPVPIYSDGDGGTSISNSRVTCNAQGKYSYWCRADGRCWELTRDTDAAPSGVIKGWGGTPGRLNVVDYGATGDASTDDVKAIQSAVNAAGQNGGAVYFPPGTYLIGSGNEVTPVSSIVIEGEGRQSIIQKPAADTADAFELDAVTDVLIRNLAFVKDGANSANDGAAIRIEGASTDITIKDVLIDMYASGVDVEGQEGATPSTCERITCINVHVKHTTAPTAGAYGFNFGDVTNVSLESCVARGCWLDGFKLRRKTLGVRMVSCLGDNNGEDGTGNGIDMYAGGDGASLTNCRFTSNAGDGIKVKSGDLNRTGASAFTLYGGVRDVNIENCYCLSNGGRGIIINRISAATDTDPLPAHISVRGGYFEANTTDGIYVRGRNVTLAGCVIRKNENHGVQVMTESLDITMRGLVIIANGQASAGTYMGITSVGDRVSIDGCIIHGKDDDFITDDSDYSSATAYHQRPIRISSGAGTHWIGPNNYFEGSSVSDTVLVSATTGQIIVDQVYGSSPSAAGYGAGPGSITRRHNAAGNPMLWIKTSEYDATNWHPVPHPGTSPSTLANDATPSVKGHWLFKTGGTTTITDFDDGVQGQIVRLLSAHTVTITHNASIINLSGGVNFAMVAGDTLSLCMFNDQVWHEIGRGDNTT